MDVDGTLTDGGFYMDGSGVEYKRFDVKDGYGIVMLQKSGVEAAFISGRRSAATDARARELGVERVVNGAKDKLPHLVAMADELGLDASEVAFVGDDMPDLECIEWAGLGIAVADAADEVLAAADWVSPKDGGKGAVRAAAEYILCMKNGQ
jgi:3-deoxy-D-manno-octulosonate 8-phosphate phosphatase (KDO 8-P phosphatase)